MLTVHAPHARALLQAIGPAGPVAPAVSQGRHWRLQSCSYSAPFDACEMDDQTCAHIQ